MENLIFIEQPGGDFVHEGFDNARWSRLRNRDRLPHYCGRSSTGVGIPMDGATPRTGKFLRSMLASSCLTAAAGTAAMASTFNETSVPGLDFPGSPLGTLLPAGTTTVLGRLVTQLDTDWFQFQGLAAGTPFSLHGHYGTGSLVERAINYNVFNSSLGYLGGGFLEGGGSTVNGTVPTDGKLIVNLFPGTAIGSVEFFEQGPVQFEQGTVQGFLGQDTISFAVDLTADTRQIPEPSSLAVMAPVLAGAFAWRRRKAKAQSSAG